MPAPFRTTISAWQAVGAVRQLSCGAFYVYIRGCGPRAAAVG